MALAAETRAGPALGRNYEGPSRRECQQALAVLVPKRTSEIRVTLVVFIQGQKLSTFEST
jgi:hypothetical protein